jgi:DNA repair protein RecO
MVRFYSKNPFYPKGKNGLLSQKEIFFPNKGYLLFLEKKSWYDPSKKTAKKLMENYLHTQGITLQTIPYRDREKIVTLFSEKNGILSMIVRGISLKKTPFALLNPFCLGDFALKKSRGELFSFIEGNPIDENFSLRKDFSYLQAAGLMTKSLLHAHFPHHDESQIYELFKCYLRKIPSFTQAEILARSFQMKFLLHEGLVHLSNRCNICTNEALFIDSGESVCYKHASPNALSFSQKEMETIHLLSFLRSISLLQQVQMNEELGIKIENIFQSLT